MKIIKDGNLRKFKETKRFTCKYCDCIFEADNTEYTVHQDQVQGPWLDVHCPCCKAGLFFDI